MKKLLWTAVALSGLILGTTAIAGKKASHSSSSAFLMFKEKHKEKYHSGQLKVKGVEAQVCQLKKGQTNRFACPSGVKQTRVRHGVWKWWWPNGKLMAKRKYHLGALVGTAKAWFDNGKLRWSETYKAGKLDGDRKVYYASGKLKLEENYSNGQRSGLQKRFWYNGKQASQGSYVEGVRTGHWKTWYINGDVKENIVYTNGQRHGRYTLWRSVCQPAGCKSVKALQGLYKNGKKDGTWTKWYFDASQQLKSKQEIWQNGRLIAS